MTVSSKVGTVFTRDLSALIKPDLDKFIVYSLTLMSLRPLLLYEGEDGGPGVRFCKSTSDRKRSKPAIQAIRGVSYRCRTQTKGDAFSCVSVKCQRSPKGNAFSCVSVECQRNPQGPGSEHLDPHPHQKYVIQVPNPTQIAVLPTGLPGPQFTKRCVGHILVLLQLCCWCFRKWVPKSS